MRKGYMEKHIDTIYNLVFMTAFFLFLWLAVELRLIYHCGGILRGMPVFYKGWIFFAKSLTQPGGIVEYIAAFFFQFFQSSPAGALVVTIQAYLVCICFDCIIKKINAPGLRFLRFTGPVIYVFLYGQYSYTFTAATALLTALIFTCIYLKVITSKQVAGYILLSIALYYSGGGAYILFAILCMLYEGLFNNNWRTCPVYLLISIIIPYILGTIVFEMSLFDTFTILLPVSFSSTFYEANRNVLIALYLLYLALPVIVLLRALWWVIIKKGFSRKDFILK